MAILTLVVYIALFFIRPMEWWGPVKYMPLIEYAAILTLLMGFIAFPKALDEHFRFVQIPQVSLILLLLFGITISWIYPFWGTGIITAFEEFGKVVVLYIIIILMGRHPGNFRVILWTIILCIAL